MKILITGNTGFKGSWLTMILNEYGHQVIGVSLPEEEISLFRLADVKKNVTKQYYEDIRHQEKLKLILKNENPELLIHFAAQPLVRESYLNPRQTVETNVMGTFNVLESLAGSSNLRSSLIITTDKVYKNFERLEGYSENDALGGHDPYSVSKAMADLATQSWIKSFPGPPIQIARAGNVIGGGDFGRNRLLPDIVRSIENSKPVIIRFPGSIRPWQHVFDCLDGYLKLIEYSLTSNSSEIWNIGPDEESIKSVIDILSELSKHMIIQSVVESNSVYHESELLTLNSAKIKKELNWKNKLDFSESVEITCKWYLSYLGGKDLRKVSFQQINQYFKF